MNRFQFVIKGRGVGNAFKRVRAIQQRFGFDSRRFLQQLNDFTRLTRRYNVRPSFPISTILLERYPGIEKELSKLDLDLLSHGYTHIDHAQVSRHKQALLIGKSKEILSSAGFSIDGFRAPYLHWNNNLMEVVSEAGFGFDSSYVYWALPAERLGLNESERRSFARAYTFYEPFFVPFGNGSLPTMHVNGLLEIPVTLPDDEILVDRLGIRDSNRLTEIFLQMLRQSQNDEGLLTLQLHPERINVLHDALEQLLLTARRPDSGVWIASLREINHWWRTKRTNSNRWPSGYRSALSITGDIDCLTIQDFAWRFTEERS